MLKINRNYLSRIETGKSEPTSGILKQIAEIFNIDLNSLLDIKEEKERIEKEKKEKEEKETKEKEEAERKEKERKEKEEQENNIISKQ